METLIKIYYTLTFIILTFIVFIIGNHIFNSISEEDTLIKIYTIGIFCLIICVHALDTIIDKDETIFNLRSLMCIFLIISLNKSYIDDVDGFIKFGFLGLSFSISIKILFNEIKELIKNNHKKND